MKVALCWSAGHNNIYAGIYFNALFCKYSMSLKCFNFPVSVLKTLTYKSISLVFIILTPSDLADDFVLNERTSIHH